MDFDTKESLFQKGLDIFNNRGTDAGLWPFYIEAPNPIVGIGYVKESSRRDVFAFDFETVVNFLYHSPYSKSGRAPGLSFMLL